MKNQDQHMRPNTALCPTALAVAFALIPSLPYGYYAVMRWIVCASCAWTALASPRMSMHGWLDGVSGSNDRYLQANFPRPCQSKIWSVVNVAAIPVVASYEVRVSLSNGRNRDE